MTRAVVELPILGLLEEKPVHGYELKRRLEGVVGYFSRVSYGSLYPTLRQLERQGDVTEAAGSKQGHERITYRVTSLGRDRFLELMRDPHVPFTLKMLFFSRVPPQDRARLLKRQRDEWVRTLEDRQAILKRISGSSADPYRMALLARSMEHLKRDIAWIENLMEGGGGQ